jgi:hypothetical protein
MTPPMLGLMYSSRLVQPEDADDFLKAINAEGLNVSVHRRDEEPIYAGIEWLMPTALVIWIGKAYIDGFLKEAGKDHYGKFKLGLSALHEKLFGPKAPQLRLMGTAGKVSDEHLYSLNFSMMAEGEEGVSFKLLVPKTADPAEYEAVVEAFLAFLRAYHQGQLEAPLVEELNRARVVGRTLLLAYNASLRRVQPVDPLDATQP